MVKAAGGNNDVVKTHLKKTGEENISGGQPKSKSAAAVSMKKCSSKYRLSRSCVAEASGGEDGMESGNDVAASAGVGRRKTSEQSMKALVWHGEQTSWRHGGIAGAGGIAA